MALRPDYERPAGELRAVVGAHRLGVAPEHLSLLPRAGDLLPAAAVAHADLHAFVAEVIGHGQALEPPAVGQAGAEAIHAPDLVDLGGDPQRQPLVCQSFGLLVLPHCEVGLAVVAIDPLVIHRWEQRADQVMDAPVAKRRRSTWAKSMIAALHVRVCPGDATPGGLRPNAS